ncbi:MAG TPA: SOS response-associated peptidase [Terracidiphilus sp.]|nr:SOS response-associated peptidase [Terracidiphilus sp.]
MCGRYYRRSDKQRIAEAFRLGLPTTFEILPSYNVAPQTFQPVVRLNEETGERELASMRWGLVPFWAKEPKIAYSTINAKAETLATSPAFREALKRRRCIIPLDGFYEWQPVSAKVKQPFAVALKSGQLFGAAGLWDRWKDKSTGQSLDTYTLITTDPNPLMEPFHNRMPVIVKPADYERWMAPADPARLPIDLLRPYPEEEMAAWKVAAAVGNVRNNSPDLIEPMEEARLF